MNNGAKIYSFKKTKDNVNLCYETGTSLLYKYCHYGHCSIVQILPINSANNNLRNKTGVSPLYIAGQNGHNSTVQLMLNQGADVNLYKETGESPVYLACPIVQDRTALTKNDTDVCKWNGSVPFMQRVRRDMIVPYNSY